MRESNDGHTGSVKKPLSNNATLELIMALFFWWGFLTSINDILVPHFQALFALSYAKSVLVPVTFFTTCFVLAPVSSIVIDRQGYRRTMVLGLLIMGIGAFMFLPAALSQSFALFLVAIGVIGAGITILQAAAAPYVSFLGPRETAPSRFSLALGFNSLGTMMAPLFGGWLILGGTVGRSSSVSAYSAAVRSEAMRGMRGPYLFLGCMLIVLAVAVASLRLPNMRKVPDPISSSKPLKSVFHHRPLVLGAFTIFLYAGAEIGISSLLINFLASREILDVNRHTAALLATIYWGGATAGRFAGWRLLRYFRVESVLATVAATAAVLIAIATGLHGEPSAIALLSVGLCNALVVPIVVMLAISGLGPLTSRASALMVAANIGAGLVPLALGWIADRTGVHHALAPLALCYGWVLFYALRGSRGHFLRREELPGLVAASGNARS